MSLARCSPNNTNQFATLAKNIRMRHARYRRITRTSFVFLVTLSLLFVHSVSRARAMLLLYSQSVVYFSLTVYFLFFSRKRVSDLGRQKCETTHYLEPPRDIPRRTYTTPQVYYSLPHIWGLSLGAHDRP